MALDPARTVRELEELRELTGDRDGAQRVAWTETWETARAWLREKVAPTGAEYELDQAGNQWATLRGALRARAADRRPHGLGAEWRLARRLPERAGRPRGAAPDRRRGHAAGHRAAGRLGRRGGRALRPQPVRLQLGAPARWRSRGSGRLEGSRRHRRCRRRWRASASICSRRARPASSSRTRPPTWSCISSRARCWRRMDLPLGVVLGTYGVERHRITWRGQAAHAGSTPMDKRRDALAGAAKLALDIRDIAAQCRRRRGVHQSAAWSASRGS